MKKKVWKTMAKRARHILGLSGGKDSTGLAIMLHKQIPNLEYFFCDTGKELKETYDYLDKIKARLGIKIEYLSAERDFDHYLDIYGGMLPSAQVRWCTKQLKLLPLEQFIGDDFTYSYIGIRADEVRDGYISSKPNIIPIYPYRPSNYFSQSITKNFKYDQVQIRQNLSDMGISIPFREEGYDINDVRNILDESGIGLPKYYEWRTRSGCYFCFFQRKYEWVMLAEKHPDLFEKAVAYEENHKDGREFFWSQGESLRDILKRKDEIVARHDKSMKKKKNAKPNRALSETLADVLDDENDDLPCIACNL